MLEWLTTEHTLRLSVLDALLIFAAYCLLQVATGFLRAWTRDRRSRG